ncbi:MAG: hypothetical protein MUF51_11880 [Vicinamibacteria bacterium]|nr:hypothetical protein [Vicinamibacteria bacterium]
MSKEHAAVTAKIEEYRSQANAQLFTRPADGIIQEDRLVKFLSIRKGVFDVYEIHKTEIEALKQRPESFGGSLSALKEVSSLINNLRLAQAKGQAEAGMSDDEYRFMVEGIYRSAWMVEYMKGSQGKTPSETIDQAVDEAQKEMDKAEAEAKSQASPAPDAATSPMDDIEPDQVRTDNLDQPLIEGAKETRKAVAALEVPPANLALFRKYEVEIKKYSMSGLELIGLF